MKLWVDDVRKAPSVFPVYDYYVFSVNQGIKIIDYLCKCHEKYPYSVHYKNILIDLDHDAGEFANDGGDYIKILDYIEAQGIGDLFVFHIHSMNPVGVENMRRIIKKNGWEEV